MIEKLKKHWFVALVAVIFIFGIVYFGREQAGKKLKGKKIDGQDIVYSIDDKNVSADEYHDLLLDAYGDAEIYKLFEKSVISSIESSDEIKEKAKKDAETVKKNVSASAGKEGLNQLEEALKSMGYKDLKELPLLYEDMYKRDELLLTFVTDNKKTYIDDYEKEFKPRLVSHILIKMDNPEQPSEEEQKVLDKVDKSLKDGKDFGEVAMELSQDEMTAPEKGSLGFMDANTQYEPSFLMTALELKDGQYSDWIKTNYGMHRILVNSSKFEDYSKDDAFIQQFMQNNPNALFKAIWEKAEDLDVEFFQEETKERLLKYMGIEGDRS